MRFLSVDPIVLDGERLQSPGRLNGYAYAANNPLKYYDPDGQDIELSSKGNASAVRDMLIETAMRPTGRADLQRIDSDHSITATLEDTRINTPTEILQAQQTRGELEFGNTHIESVSSDAQGNTHLNIKVEIDTKAIEQAHPTDKSGVATTAHEGAHVEDLRKGKTDKQFLAGDKPTSGTGPAAQHGNAVANEKPDISRREAKKIVKQMLKN